MYNKALEVLNILTEHGFLAYIVGGYPRDTLLNIETKDIDICTNAKPKEIIALFDTEDIGEAGYGSVKVIYKNAKFDVTTFRKDVKYEDNRKPVKIKYIKDLKKDLLRRDFTINTICIDKDENYIDMLNGKMDIERKIIKTVGNPKIKIKEDTLRILRAIRFATILGFDIEEKTKLYLIKYGNQLTKLSNSRKKEELNKIFSSKNKEKGRQLLLELKLDRYLGLNNLKDIVMCDDIIGIWSQLDFSYEYPFSKLEKEQIKKIKEMLKLEINEFSIYKYGLYTSTVVGSIKNMDYKRINEIYQGLPIYSRKDINISGLEISSYLKKEPGEYITKILEDIEFQILDKKLSNQKEQILKYIGDNYGNI